VRHDMRNHVRPKYLCKNASRIPKAYGFHGIRPDCLISASVPSFPLLRAKLKLHCLFCLPTGFFAPNEVRERV